MKTNGTQMENLSDFIYYPKETPSIPSLFCNYEEVQRPWTMLSALQ